MPIFRRTLTVAAVTAVGTFAFALPAWAHTVDFSRDCGELTLTLNDNFPAGTYDITVFRNGEDVDEFEYTSPTDPRVVTYDESNEEGISYHLTWTNQDNPKDTSTTDDVTPDAPKNCNEDNPSEGDNPPGDNDNPPAEDNPSTDTETTPAKAPATTTAAPATTSPAPVAVNADKLANTGAGNTVPLLVVGTVLVAGGVGLTFMTRRRHSGNASS